MKDNTALKGLIAIVVIAALVGGTIFLNQDDDEAASSETATTQTTQTAQNTSNEAPVDNSDGEMDPDADNTYTNGTYTASGTYNSPGGNESLDVTVTLEDDTITSVDIAPGANHPTSVQFQDSFISGIAELVVGVSLDDADVDFVAGSSLTSRGFNQALDEIKGQANPS